MGKMINLWVPTCFSLFCQTNPGVPGYRIGPVKDMKPVVWTLCVVILYLLGGQNLWKCEYGGGHPFVYMCQLLAIGMSVNTSITSGADSSVVHLRRIWNVGYQASDEEILACCPNIRVTSKIGNQCASTLWLYTLLLFNAAINKKTHFLMVNHHVYHLQMGHVPQLRQIIRGYIIVDWLPISQVAGRWGWLVLRSSFLSRFVLRNRHPCPSQLCFLI